MARLQLYTRERCHLCEDAAAALERVRQIVAFELEVIDVDGDPELAERYGMEVPVILCDGVKVAKFRVDERRLLKRLQGRSGATSRGAAT